MPTSSHQRSNMPKDRPQLSAWRLTVGQLNELLDLADFPEVGAAIRARVRNIVREVFDMHTRPKYQEDKWPVFREKLIEIYPPLQDFPRRIEALEAYARRNAVDQISRRRLSRQTNTRDVDIRHELGTQVLVHDRHKLIIRPTSTPTHLIRPSYGEEIPTQGRISIPTCKCYAPYPTPYKHSLEPSKKWSFTRT